MIMKIRNDFSDGGWFIKDNISEISYQRGLGKDKLIAPIDRHFDSKPFPNNSPYAQILITFRNGTEEVWITQVTTYLLNDEGKTIERI